MKIGLTWKHHVWVSIKETDSMVVNPSPQLYDMVSGEVIVPFEPLSLCQVTLYGNYSRGPPTHAKQKQSSMNGSLRQTNGRMHIKKSVLQKSLFHSSRYSKPSVSVDTRNVTDSLMPTWTSSDSLNYIDFSFSAAGLWNQLPDHLRTSSDLSTFKSSLETHFFHCCFIS